MKNILMLSFTSALAFSEGVPRIKVACVGDSITFGFGIKNRGKQSYSAQLGEGWTVGSFGRNGRTVFIQGHTPYWEEHKIRDWSLIIRRRSPRTPSYTIQLFITLLHPELVTT